MNEQDVRALVREAIERHLARPERPVRSDHDDFAATQAAEYPKAADHPSHVLLKVVAGSDSDDGMCVIEPSVRCNHCGFCQSFGH